MGTLTVRDTHNRTLYNNSFPSSSPTIFFTNSTLTNGLHMKFDSSLDIAEIEVFGGMYEHFVPRLYNIKTLTINEEKNDFFLTNTY